MRMGVNQTNWVSDAPGWVQTYGNQAVLQQGPKALVVSSPWASLDVNRKITSLQSSIALYNYELPAPTWEIYLDGQRVTALPARAKANAIPRPRPDAAPVTSTTFPLNRSRSLRPQDLLLIFETFLSSRLTAY